MAPCRAVLAAVKKKAHIRKCKCGKPVEHQQTMTRCLKCNAAYIRERRRAGLWPDPRPNHRSSTGDKVCVCNAYLYPHNQFSGKCTLYRWVKSFHEPHREECRGCINVSDEGECQVVLKVETPWHCPALRDYVRFEGIKLYGRAREQRDESERRAR